MFKEMGSLMSLLSQAKEIPGKMQAVAEDLKGKRAEGTAGGGMVKIEVNGLGQVLKCRLEPSLVNGGDRELMEDLIAAAVNQAQEKARVMHAEAMKGVTGGIQLPPGLDDMVGKMTGGIKTP